MPDDKKPVRSNIATRALRGAMGLVPLPAAQLIASTVTRDTKFGFDDAPEGVRNELIRSVMKAHERTGSDRGGTSYEDYSPSIAKDINSLNVNLGDALVGSVKADDFRAATTFGRVSYKYDPETETYYVYDSYDFTKTPRKNNTYSTVRAAAGKVAPQEGEAKLIGTFKKSDYANLQGKNEYAKVKGEIEEDKKTVEKKKKSEFSSKAVQQAKARQFSPLTKFKNGGKVRTKSELSKMMAKKLSKR